MARQSIRARRVSERQRPRHPTTTADASARRPARLEPSLRGAVISTRQGALRSTYSVTGPISAGREPPMPPRIAPPRILLGGSPPITITSTPRSRAASTIPATDAARPDHREVDLDRLVLLAHLLRPLQRRFAASIRSGGGGESSGTVSGRSTT